MNNFPVQSNQKNLINSQSSIHQSQIFSQNKSPKRIDQSIVISKNIGLEEDYENSYKMKPQILLINNKTSSAIHINKSSNVIYQALNNIRNQYIQSEKIIDEFRSSLENCSSNSLDLFKKNLFGILQSNKSDQSNILSFSEIKSYSKFSNK